jgi:hypothetical protein
LGCFLGSAVVGAGLTRSLGALSAIVPSAFVALLSWQAFRERRAARERQLPIVVPSPIGMRRPTPIHRPLSRHPRPESGTRFKAVRLTDVDADAGADELAATRDRRIKRS